MNAKVQVNKNQLDRFRKFARETDKEIQAYLIGRIVNEDLTVIEKFVYPKKYAVQKSNEVSWFEDEYQEVKQLAEASGRKLVGDIHSHPQWDAVMSKKDAISHKKDGNRVSGICSINSGRTRVRFWIIESAIPCDIEYAEKES